MEKSNSKRKSPPNKICLSPEQEAFLLNNFYSMTNQQIADELGMKLTWTRDYLYKLGLKRMELEYWTEEQTSFLTENYQALGDVELADIFNQKWIKNKPWTKKHIEKKRNYLQLHRTPEELKAIHQRNVDAGRFLICSVKRWATTGQATEGEIRFWREHSGRFVPRIKINGAFIHWARYTWEQRFGPVPEGMNVVFKDNDPTNVVLENLALYTNAELSARNSAISSKGLSDNYIAGMLSHNQPELREYIKHYPELIELKRNQLLLNRQINKNGKH